MAVTSWAVWEIPPRARRRAVLAWAKPAVTRNTSACAEKSMRRATIVVVIWKYLRVRGEEVTGGPM